MPTPPSERAAVLFGAIVDLPPAEREARLAASCGGDPALLSEVRALLAAHESAPTAFLRSPGAGLSGQGHPTSTGSTERAGEMIGRYRLQQEIGEGGFGTVWMAEQVEPVTRRVALKIIKLGMDTREVIARFEAERQALAMMDHPNIATVLDAGATERGRPFFVMELVKGMPITRYCDEAGLGTNERLALFSDVCSAINHAHQKGIIHRDIKPSNVMVTLHGDRPVVKVIDFGIAKATQGKLTDKTLFTKYEQMIGTPAYMSPEQASLSGLDVDTRSDIYALGILLYELLTGKPPFDAKSLLSAGYEEMRRIIREVEPARPSSRLSTVAGQERVTLAKAHRTEPGKVSRMVEPDLDWIVMKAIEKDRARRYETANGFAQDIARFLANEPVTAAAPSVAYRFRKFARRNKAALAVAALVFGVLVAATGVSLWQANVALAAKKDAILKADAERVAREESQAITRFLIGVFQSPNPERDGRTITVAETLRHALRKLETDLTSQPERRAALLETVGATYIALGLARDAIGPLEKARDLRIAALGPHHPDTLLAISHLADAFHGTSRREEALKLREEVLAIRRKVLGSDHRDILDGMNDLALSYHAAGRMEAALELQEDALSLIRQKNLPEDQNTLRGLGNLAAIYFDLERREEAHALLTEILAISGRVNGPEHPDTLMATSNVATSLDNLGQHEEALEMRKDNLEPNQRVNGKDHPATLMAMNNLAVSYSWLGYVAAALEIQEEILPISEEVHGREDPATLGAMTNLAVSYRKLRRFEEAIELQRDALELKERFLPEGHAFIAAAVENLADCYRDAGRPDEERAYRLKLAALRGRQPGSATKDPAVSGAASPAPRTTPMPPVAATLVAPDSEWKWLHPIDGIDPAEGDPEFHTTFFVPDFEDSAWQSGLDSADPTGGFGYGRGFTGLDIGRPENEAHRHSAYFRHRFRTDKPCANLELRCQRDDALIVYLDGKEVLRDNLPDGPDAYQLSASIPQGPNNDGLIHRFPIRGGLDPGEHVLAISLHNAEAPSSDLRLGGVTLVAVTPLPAD